MFYHSNPLFRNAFKSTSWKLNAGGMALFEEGIKMLEALEDNMTLLDDDTVKEVFKGLSKDGYIGYYRLQKSLPIFSTSSFQKSYLTTRFNERKNDSSDNDNIETDEDGDALCDDYNLDSRLASPGMEHLLKEQMETNKRLPENIKWNQSYEIAKVCADTLKCMQQCQYESHFNCFKSFSKSLGEGLPSHVIDFLMNPEKFEIVKKSTLSSGALLQESCSSTSRSSLSNPVAPALQQSLETVEKQTPYKDVPEHLKIMLTFLIASFFHLILMAFVCISLLQLTSVETEAWIMSSEDSATSSLSITGGTINIFGHFLLKKLLFRQTLI